MVDFKWMQIQSAASLDRAGRQHLDRAALKQRQAICRLRCSATLGVGCMGTSLSLGQFRSPAARLDVKRTTLIAKMKKLGISRPMRRVNTAPELVRMMGKIKGLPEKA